MKEKPLDKYTIDALSKRMTGPSQIIFDEVIATTASYTVQRFHFTTDGKTVTGLSHLPALTAVRQAAGQPPKKLPVIIQFRGFAPKETYESGVGTKHSAEVYAANGYLSLAPDFLGYGSSDMPGDDTVFEERFQTYTTALDLIHSVSTIPFADPNRIGLWGHSNGGQIALTVLTVLGSGGKQYPTTLWAPVSKAFPYNILAYTDEFDDGGKALRRELADFEKDYDVDRYSFTNFLDRISSPLELHQGTADIEVPVFWSDEFVTTAKSKGLSVRYFTYPGTDHNFNTNWNTVVARDLEFFRTYLK